MAEGLSINAEGCVRLPEDEALFRAVFEQAAVGVALIETATGRYLRVNQSHCDLIGYTREETLRLDFQTITHPEDLDEDLQQMERLKAGEVRSFALEKRYFRKDGGTVWVSLTVSPLWKPGESPDFHVAVVRDITERKRAEEALRDSEEIFEQLLEHSPFYVFFKDEEIRSIRLSRNYEKMLGQPLEELLGKSMDDLFPSDLAKSMIEDDKRILEKGDVVTVDEELAGHHYHTIKFPIHRDGKPLYLGGFTIDVTEQVEAERALRESEEKYRRLYNEAPVMLHSIDPQGRLISVSDRWCEIMGYEREEVLGRKSTDFLTEASRAYAETVAFPRFFERGAARDIPYQFVKRSGEVMDVFLSAVAELDADGQVVCYRAALTDVTERKRVENALRQAQKMESIGRLAGGIAHDFNNLLMVILSNIEFALEELRENDALSEALDDVHKAGLRAATLTQQLLAFSRRQVLRPRIVNLNEAVSGVERMVRRLIGEDIALETDLASDLGLIRADPGQVEQVIINLVLNGRESMPAGGCILVETHNVTVGAEQASRLGDIEPDDYVVLSVADTGSGMDERTLAQLFEPFFTTKREGKGVGLGLATVYGIIKQSGGYIDVSSTLGEGTRFDVYFPRDLRDAPSAIEDLHAKEVVHGTETVLVVEDEEAVRTIARKMLEHAGYVVVCAADGLEALEVFERSTPPIDIVLSDVIMPRMGGAELAQRLARDYSEVPVVLMSGYTDDAIARAGALVRESTFLPKPFSAATLTRCLRGVLDGRT